MSGLFSGTKNARQENDNQKESAEQAVVSHSKVRAQLTLPAWVLEKAKRDADADGRTLSGYIQHLIKSA